MRIATSKFRSPAGSQIESPAADRRRERPRAKVKTGCRTCKNRKVKCDETRPACARCCSAGRVCEGYGVWGGGSTDAVHCAVPTEAGRSRQPFSISRHVLRGTIVSMSSQEYGCLDWFRYRTAIKLKGAFSMAFWDVLVIRASLEEPAILHAALALSAVHRRVGGGEIEGVVLVPDETCGEEFALCQYNKAIHCLTAATSSSVHDVASTRIALVACMLFTCLEYMRGHFQTGNNHLRNGIRLLAALQRDAHPRKAIGAFDLVADRHCFTSCMDPIDQSLVEAFTRMNLLAAQLGYAAPLSLRLPSTPRYFFSPKHQLVALPITFASVYQARGILDQLLYDILALADQSGRVPGSAGERTLLVAEQERIRSDLRAWGTTYRASRLRLDARTDLLSKVGYLILMLYYDMATILADTCLDAGTELAFDRHGHQFVSILQNALLLFNAVRAVHSSRDPNFSVREARRLDAGTAETAAATATPATTPPVCLFSADSGWMPPLYFTVLHCRVRRIRQQALRFLEMFPSREGMWDAKLVSVVAHRVTFLEEAGLPEEPEATTATPIDNELFNADRCPLLPFIPASHPRIHDVHIVLPDSWSGATTMSCERRWANGTSEPIVNVYHSTTGQWNSPETIPE